MSNNSYTIQTPTALLVLRVWMERGSALPLRAYIQQTSDVSHGFQNSSTETDIEAAVGTVRTWLEDLLDALPADVADIPLNGHAPPTDNPATHPGDDHTASTNATDPGTTD